MKASAPGESGSEKKRKSHGSSMLNASCGLWACWSLEGGEGRKSRSPDLALGLKSGGNHVTSLDLRLSSLSHIQIYGL